MAAGFAPTATWGEPATAWGADPGDDHDVSRSELAAVPLEALLTTVVAVLVVLAVAAEAAWLAATDGRRRLADHPTAVVMGLGSLVVAPWFLRAYAELWPLVGRLAPVRFGHPVVQALVAFVAWDAAGYVYHRLGHRTRLGWAAHQPHHSGTGYDLSLALRQTWLPLPALVTFPLVALAGVPLPTALGAAALSNLWQALVHTAVPVRVPTWLAVAVVTPASHRVHHEAGGPAVNLGAVLTVWDRLGGTWRSAAAEPQPRPPVAVAGPVATELRGWRQLAATVARRGRSGSA